MKKLLFTLAIIFPMFAFMGCGSDKEEPNPPTDRTITTQELESAPSFVHDYPDGGKLYIKFRDGHIYTKEVTKDGVVMNQDDIIYTLSGENITMEMGWQKTRGTINKVVFNDGNTGIVMNFEGGFGIATWLSKTFRWNNNTFEQTF